MGVGNPAQATTDAAQWFQSVRQYCNPVEVETRKSWQLAPQTPEREMHKAACYALAGRIDRAPNHYMALYHAGAARFDLGDYEVAEGYLKRFLVEYTADDGWTGSARTTLERIGDR